MRFPTAPPATDEQLGLALEERGRRPPLSVRYARWKAQHPEIVNEVLRRVVARAKSGDRRIEINDVVADVRKDWKVSIDNSYRSRLADDAVARFPYLDPLIERRRRKAG